MNVTLTSAERQRGIQVYYTSPHSKMLFHFLDFRISVSVERRQLSSRHIHSNGEVSQPELSVTER
jgi:hypothetical protein